MGWGTNEIRKWISFFQDKSHSEWLKSLFKAKEIIATRIRAYEIVKRSEMVYTILLWSLKTE